jgi:hypothetical protein
MASIRVRFIRNAGFTSGGISRLTGSLFSHVEFGTPEGTWIGAHIGGGIQERPADYCNPVLEYVYEVPCTALQQTQGLAKMRAGIGTKYNTLDIVGLMFQARSLRSPHRLICSQFYADIMLFVFGATRFLNVNEDWTYRITPETGHLSPLLVGHRVKALVSGRELSPEMFGRIPR